MCVWNSRNKLNKKHQIKQLDWISSSLFFSWPISSSFLFKIVLTWIFAVGLNLSLWFVSFRLVVVDEVRMYVYNKLQHKIYSNFGIIPRRMVMVRGWRWRWRRVGDGETARQISRRRCGGGGWRADGGYRRLTAHHGLSFNTAGTATDRLLLLLLMMSIAAASIGVRKGRTWTGTVIRVPCKVMTICSRKKNKSSDS